MIDVLAIGVILWATWKGSRMEKAQKVQIEEMKTIKKKKEVAQGEQEDFDVKVKPVEDSDIEPITTNQETQVQEASREDLEEVQPININQSIDDQEVVTEVEITQPEHFEEAVDIKDELKGLR